MRDRILRALFWCSVGFHIRSALAWYCERAGETPARTTLRK